MYFVALKMLIGDRGKYLGIIMGLTLASLEINDPRGVLAGICRVSRPLNPIRSSIEPI